MAKEYSRVFHEIRHGDLVIMHGVGSFIVVQNNCEEYYVKGNDLSELMQWAEIDAIERPDPITGEYRPVWQSINAGLKCKLARNGELY